MQAASRSRPTGARRRVPPAATILPRNVVPELEKHVLIDGFRLVFDLQRSSGSIFVDAAGGRRLIDLYSFYASQPIGFNHPWFNRPEVKKELLEAAKFKVANPDVYTVQYANFVSTFARVAGMPPLNRYFFIEGGALAVENALKAAMDWKVRKNLAAGRGERGTGIIHFRNAFHGRSGYTLSLTNTDPRKTDYFAKFPWPRILAPSIDFSLPPGRRLEKVIQLEKEAERQILSAIKRQPHDNAAIVIEPIQGEGGDNHFRSEFFHTLRRICDQHELLLIFDEVQAGMGITGRTWCCQHFGVKPDLLAFGKKIQVCGVMAGPRLDEVKDNCFRLPSRISSTWGGNFTDFVRSTHYLRIIEAEDLVRNARIQGALLLKGLNEIAKRYPVITAARGRGLMVAFDLPDTATRDAFWKGAWELGLLVVRSGTRSIRLRPALDIKSDILKSALEILEHQCRRI